MKSLIAMILVACSFSALASLECKTYEAQFFGKVKKLKQHERHFTFQVEVTGPFNMHVLCPLDIPEVESAVISLPGQTYLEEGSEISGVMVYDVASESYKID